MTKRFARTPDHNGDNDMATPLEATPLEASNPAANLEATPPANGDATEGAAPAANPNQIKFEVEGYDKPVEVDLVKMPPEVRQRLMYTATRSYILNRVSTATASAKTSNKPFEAYDAAQKNDPTQTHIAKPDGERKTVDIAAIIDGAINALYSGEIGKRGAGTSKAPKDPLVEHVTRVVVSEVYKKAHDADPTYKYFKAQAEVGNNGIEYLKKKIAQNVADYGVDEKQQMEMLEQRYLKPARITLGLEELGGKLKGVEGII